MTTVAVLGCGLIGSSWLEAFISCGMQVRAWDPDISRLRSMGKRDGLEIFNSPQAAVTGATFVQESGPEDLEKKKQLYAAIVENLDPEAIVASSTSTLQPSQLQNRIAFSERIVVGHPFNPPHILPLVEVVGGKETAQWVIERALTFYRSLGKHPIHLRTERLGHLANRLQAAMWREAIDAVANGQATVKDVDTAVTLALGPRWALLGPFSTFHLGGGGGGLRHFLEHLQKPFEAIWDDAQRPTVSEELKSNLIDAVSELFAGRSPDDLTRERDDCLNAVLSITDATSRSPLARAQENEMRAHRETGAST